MEQGKCFDMTTMVTDKVTKQFEYRLKENNSKRTHLQEICKIIDELFLEFEGICYDVEIDYETMKISISMDCMSLQAYDTLDYLYRVAECAEKLKFKWINDERIRATFVFDGIWDYVHSTEESK